MTGLDIRPVELSTDLGITTGSPSAPLNASMKKIEEKAILALIAHESFITRPRKVKVIDLPLNT